MFLRFTVPVRDPDTGCETGIFNAAYAILRGGELEPYEREWVEETLDWFKENLPVPKCFGKASSQGAICWFRAEAGEVVQRIWDLVAFVECQDLLVRMLKTKDPGIRIHQDDYQVVAFPGTRRGRI